jgi:sterol desaturase/sphingolipid hydroxylase (fatty acid hydroxylase superfamily)
MNFLSFLYPTFFISKILVGSTFTAFCICKLNHQSFFNQELYSHEYLIHKVNTISNVGKLVIVNYNIIYFSLSQYYLHEKSFHLLDRIFQNIQFIFLLELFAYIYHRLSHKIPYLFNKKHSIHHKNITIYPIDFLEFDITDNIAQTLYINLPLYFVPMHIYDYSMIYFIYSTCAFLIHSNILTNDHIIHHKYFKYNYSLLIPVFDHLFGTYKQEEMVELVE